VRSFDVFDTLLTRKLGNPNAVFPVVAGWLADEGVLVGPVEAFAAARRRVEDRLGRLRGRPPKLAEIATELAVLLGLPADAAGVIADAELRCERELVVAMPGAAGLVAEARALGQVVFVSDTPLPESFIRELLEREELALPTDPVFASSDRGASKASGQLFDLVAPELGATPSDLKHHGDNEMADIAAARERGWDAQPMPAGRLNRYEHILESDAGASAGLTSWMAGASRLARLSAGTRGVDPAIAAVAAGVMAPMLVGYALWVAGQARARGIRRLYFVARDGEVMHHVARIVLAQVAPDLECRYLYGSRQAWIFPSIATSDELLDRWVTFRTDFTARAAVARVGLSLEEARDLTGLPFTDPSLPERPLGADERRQLGEGLRRGPVLELIRLRARQQAENTAAYLAQEGFGDGVPSALVDAGWAGATAKAFDQLLASSGYPPVVHLFIGLQEGAEQVRQSEQPPELTAWLFDRHELRGADHPMPGANVLFELLCAGTEGRLLGYDRDGVRIVPRLERPTNDEVLGWGLPDVRRVVQEAVEFSAPHLRPGDRGTDLSGVVTSVLSQFWMQPSSDEARAWGSFPWEEETWPPYYPVAEPLTTTSVMTTLARRDGRIRRHNSWQAGTAALSSAPWSALLRGRRWQQENKARFARIPRRLRLEIARRR
jgi:FMN phosphatase YigB (HAD superfamily)